MPIIDEQEDFLRRKIDESTADYSDQYWEGAKQLLGTNRRRKFGWWWMPVIILLPVITAVSYFGLKETNRAEQKVTVASVHINNSIASNNAGVVLANGSIPSRAAFAPLAKESKFANSTLLNKNRKGGQSSITDIAQTNKLKAQSTRTTKKNDAGTTKALANITNPSPTISNKTPILENRTITSTTEAQNDVSASSNSISTTIADKLSETVTNESQTTNQQANSPAKESISINNNLTTTNLLNDTSNLTSVRPAQAYNKSENTSAAIIDTAKQTLKDNAAIISIPAVINKVDTASNQSIAKSNFSNKILSIHGGCNFNKGINAAGSNSFSVGALPYIGVAFAVPVSSSKVSIQGGLVLNMYNPLHSQTDIHHSNYYSFGYGNPAESLDAPPAPVTDTVFSLHQQLLFTLQLPVVVNYYINGKNSLSAGAGIAYTLGVYSKVINFNGTETSSFGYGQGYKPFNAFIQIGYCYNFNKAWAFELNIQQGLTDMTDDAFFNSTRKDRFSNLQIGLTHEFAIKPKKIFYDKK